MTKTSMQSLANFIKNNSSLEKLLLQHNELDDHCTFDLAEALTDHPSIKYLDISANNIKTHGFKELMGRIISGKIPLHTF